jgi:anti-anti-sigma regulatory factor
MGKKKQDKKGNIEIDSSLCVSNASMIHNKIMEAYKELEAIEIDLKNITDCDTAGIQLLYALKKSCVDAGKSFSLINPSDAVTEALRRAAIPWEAFDC